MKSYTIIPNEAGGIFTPRDLYTLTCLYLTAKDDYTTNSTREQLAKITGLSFAYIKDKFLTRLRKSNFCEIEEYIEFSNSLIRKRNKYILSKPITNFKIISKEILEDTNLTPSEKGIMIGLYSLTVNNSFNIGFSKSEIAKRLKLSSKTYLKYEKALIEKGYIKLLSEDITNDRHEDFDGGIVLNCSWLGTKELNTKVYESTHNNINRQ
ncbi:helix-turn-helix domain-containing protein [Dysgonomonas sp. Marseille-P4361]|uniref:helix-turn-helix domain-containing protein n=1 Tax=Dysgonomonas sp. Marseille-P4361 TaxID=2161820 RepID=UPI000D5554D6|nr:helix-turn-helix domain-containing protein [Dysgonomonas sp. Marseille-P4361]